MDLSCWKVHINLNMFHMKTVGIVELFAYLDGKRCRDTKYQIKLFEDQPMLSGNGRHGLETYLLTSLKT